MLMIDANDGGSIEALTRHLGCDGGAQRGVHPHFYGVTKLNLQSTR